jgi:replicative DNA helicase
VKRLNTRQIRQRVRMLIANQELDLLMLDGLLQIDDLRLDTSMSKKQVRYVEAKRRDAIDNIMNDLEAIGMTYNLPILLSHQINRAPAGRQNKRPQLSDLAEASFVEQKSALVLFLYRESYYDPACLDPHRAEIIAAKNRHGETGTITVYNDAAHTRMLDATIERVTFGE